MRSSCGIGAIIVVASAGLAQAQPITFFSSDNETLYRGTNSGLDAAFGGPDEIRGMSLLENGASIGGASAGDVIGVSSPQRVNEDQVVYRIDNAFAGSPSLVSLGTIDLANAVSDIAFANGKMYGVRNSGPAGTILIHEFDAGFAVANTWDTGISLTDKGAGGLAYDNASGLFFVTDPDSDKLWSYSLGGSASLVGDVGFDYGNNDLSMFNGRLYAAIADLGTNDYDIGYFSMGDGSFTNVVTVGSYLGGSIGAVVVPGAPSVLVLGMAGFAGLRRRR
ncbi:MAG: hypothetical protein IPJ41_18280 [Phycisphaerales bacterium]|nr:hypothetical protein [Phycisphaerales bacterium]